MNVNNTKPSRSKRRRRKKSTLSGKVVGRMWTRSGYMIVRSINNNLADNCRPTSTKTTGKRSAGNGAPDFNRAKASSASANQKIVHSARLHESVIQPSFINSLKKKWKKNRAMTTPIADVISYPFKVVTLHQLFDRTDYLDKLTSELSSLEFRRLDNDLYSFEQTCDLFELNSCSPAISSLLQFLKGPLHSWMQNVTGKELSEKVVATGSKYTHTDHLLCHDDQLSDRSIAFILYLCKNWSESDGGALQLYVCNDNDQPDSVVHSLYPKYGSFAFFEVTKRSYHQVQEVLSQDKSRLSINGWFHGEQLPAKTHVVSKPPKFKPPVPPVGCSFKKWMRSCWLNPENHATIKSKFCYELSVCLPNFFNGNIYAELEKSFFDQNIIWKKCGPANQRNYERAKLSTLPHVLRQFVKLLQSTYMFYFLSEVTVDIDPDSKITPKYQLEVQRWSPGDYTLLVDNDPASAITGIDVHLYFNVRSQLSSQNGSVHYLGPDKDSKGFLKENTQLIPEGNCLFLVAHIAGMNRLTEYINHHHNVNFHKIIATYSQG